MTSLQVKARYYRVGYWNNEVATYKFFRMRKEALEFIETIGKKNVIDVIFMRELDII